MGSTDQRCWHSRDLQSSGRGLRLPASSGRYPRERRLCVNSPLLSLSPNRDRRRCSSQRISRAGHVCFVPEFESAIRNDGNYRHGWLNFLLIDERPQLPCGRSSFFELLHCPPLYHQIGVQRKQFDWLDRAVIGPYQINLTITRSVSVLSERFNRGSCTKLTLMRKGFISMFLRV